MKRNRDGTPVDLKGKDGLLHPENTVLHTLLSSLTSCVLEDEPTIAKLPELGSDDIASFLRTLQTPKDVVVVDGTVYDRRRPNPAEPSSSILENGQSEPPTKRRRISTAEAMVGTHRYYSVRDVGFQVNTPMISECHEVGPSCVACSVQCDLLERERVAARNETAAREAQFQKERSAFEEEKKRWLEKEQEHEIRIEVLEKRSQNWKMRFERRLNALVSTTANFDTDELADDLSDSELPEMDPILFRRETYVRRPPSPPTLLSDFDPEELALEHCRKQLVAARGFSSPFPRTLPPPTVPVGHSEAFPILVDALPEQVPTPQQVKPTPQRVLKPTPQRVQKPKRANRRSTQKRAKRKSTPRRGKRKSTPRGKKRKPPFCTVCKLPVAGHRRKGRKLYHSDDEDSSDE